MTKTEIIEHLAHRHAVSKMVAKDIFEDLVNIINEGIRKQGRIAITGLGTFTVNKRAARAGFNPSTGAKIKIKAAKVPKFKAAPTLKESASKFKG